MYSYICSAVFMFMTRTTTVSIRTRNTLLFVSNKLFDLSYRKGNFKMTGCYTVHGKHAADKTANTSPEQAYLPILPSASLSNSLNLAVTYKENLICIVVRTFKQLQNIMIIIIMIH